MRYLDFARHSSTALFSLSLLVLAPSPTWSGGTPATGALTDQLMTPGGGGALGSIGDFISSNRTSTLSGPGLSLPYRFYIEVPTGATALQVEIFDADIMAGGAADITGERDQNRDLAGAVNTKTRYRLFDPSGNLVASRFNFGDDATPTGSDNAWLLMYDNTTAGITGGDTFADDFSTAGVYTNDTGNQSFTGAWIESNDLGGAGAGTGDVLVTGGELSIDNQSNGVPFTNQPSVEREMNLSAYSAAVVSFDWRTGSGVDIISNGGDSGDSFSVDVSNDGGTTWEILDEFGNISGVTSGSTLYDITGYISANTRVRLRITNRYAGANETLFVDNFQVRATTTANGAAPAPGHWQLEVDMSGLVNGEIAGIRTHQQDDVNAYGMRAHDGDATSGGTEYNMYAHSYVIVGINDNDRQRNYDLHPYMTKGCDASVHNFDFDANAPNPPLPNTNVQPFGSITMTSRSGGFSHTNATVSDDDTWQSEPINSWVSDDDADEYGIWDMDVRIDDWDQNNYGPMYINTDLGTGAPPSASPEPETFRIYFPNDAGNAPAKPYMQQYLTYVEGQSSGPNPPGVGQTSRYAVTVRVVNPTGSIGDITFSNTDVVTAHLPSGAETAYGGLAFTSTGSIVSQPTIGATTGDITWNPGTLAPGADEGMVYFVDITPTVAGDLVVTGTSGTGNGTRSTFVDETGVTSFNFGELCRLQMTISPAVPVLVSDFAMERVGGSPVVTWRTAGEAETVALDLYRIEDDGRRVKVNGAPITPNIGHPQGGVYRLVDDGASLDRVSSYELVETESTGKTKVHGPFTASFRDAAPSAAIPVGLDRVPHPTPQGDVERLVQSHLAQAADAGRGRGAEAGLEHGLVAPELEAAEGGAPASWAEQVLRVKTREPGIYRIEAAELAAMYGIGKRRASGLISRNLVILQLQGEEVTWRKVGRGEAIEFYAEPLDHPFTAEQVYRLTLGRGQVAAEPRTVPAADWSVADFESTVHFEESTRPVVLMDIDPESDTWFWEFVSEGKPSQDFTFTAHGAVADEPAGLALNLQGAIEGEHVAQVYLNNQLVGEARVQDLAASTVSLPLTSGLVQDGANTLRLDLQGAGLLFLDSLDLTYTRRLEPENNSLIVSGTADQWSAAPYADDDVRVFDITQPKAPRLLPVRVLPEGDTFRAVWQARGAGPFVAASRSGVLKPVLELDAPSDLKNPANGAQYLVLTRGELMESAQRLAAYRAAQGLSTMVVDLDDVFDEFAHGLADIRAVRDFLALARSTWSEAPRYVLLLGAGTYDYHDHWGLGGNRIPVLLANNGSSLYGSDSALADGDRDGLPELAIGRLPVLTDAEADAFLAKLQAYEQGSGTWQERVGIFTDAYDAGEDEDFSVAGTHLDSILPRGFDGLHVSLDDASLDDARSQLFGDLDAGIGWLHYVGHGGVDRLASAGLLTSADVPSLSHGVSPVVSSATCLINYHGLPGFDALGEHLVLRPDGGAVAVFAPTWMVPAYPASWVSDRLFREVFQGSLQGETLRLGDALQATLASAVAQGVEGAVLGTYQLLGDPAMVLRVKPSEAEGDTCSPNCSGPG